MKNRLNRDFFERPTVVVAQELLGKLLVRIDEDGELLVGRISETEAYVGPEDLACHGRSGKTQRNRALWGPPGHAYVYFNYGMHWLLNFVTEREGFPAAALIRGMVVEQGLEKVARRRSKAPRQRWTDGPAKICQALAVDARLDGCDLCQPDSPLFLQRRPPLAPEKIRRGPRVGINSVPEPWKSMPWRFWVDL